MADFSTAVLTSSLHLDVLRDMKRINSHIAAAAYPVLERQGELLSSRLRREPDIDEADTVSSVNRDN